MTKPAKAEETSGGVTWGPLVAVVVTIGAFFLSQFIVGLVVSLIPLFTGWDEGRLNNWLDNSLAAEFGIALAVQALLLILLGYFLKKRKARPQSIGLVRPQVLDIWWAVKGYLTYFLVLIVITQLAARLIPGFNLEQEQNLGFSKATTGLGLVPVFVSLVLLPPLVEEILFRGFLYSGLRRKYPIWAAGFFVSVLFAVAHLQLGSGSAPVWIAALDTFVLSGILVYLREKTGSLWPSIGVHMLKNATAFLVLFVVKS